MPESTVLRVVMQRLEDGPGYRAVCPDLQGCHRKGQPSARQWTPYARWRPRCWPSVARMASRFPQRPHGPTGCSWTGNWP